MCSTTGIHRNLNANFYFTRTAGNAPLRDPNARVIFVRDMIASHRLIGQLPGVSQGAGVGRVAAAISVEVGPSTPSTTAETCQR